MECVVHNQVMEYFNRNNISSEAQFGFRKGHSTTTCILSFRNDVYLNLDNGKYTGVVFLDLKKAFDTVDHAILVRKLGLYWLGNRARDWFKSYLSNRVQMARVNGCISDSRIMS